MLITNFSSLPHLGPQEVVKRGQLRMEKWDMRSADAWSVVLSFLRNTQRWLESYNYCKSVVVRISEIYTTKANHIGCQVMNSFVFLPLFNIVLSPKCSDNKSGYTGTRKHRQPPQTKLMCYDTFNNVTSVSSLIVACQVSIRVWTAAQPSMPLLSEMPE